MPPNTTSSLAKAAIAALALAYVTMASGPAAAADIASPSVGNADSLVGSKAEQLKLLRRSLGDDHEHGGEDHTHEGDVIVVDNPEHDDHEHGEGEGQHTHVEEHGQDHNETAAPTANVENHDDNGDHNEPAAVDHGADDLDHDEPAAVEHGPDHADHNETEVHGPDHDDHGDEAHNVTLPEGVVPDHDGDDHGEDGDDHDGHDHGEDGDDHDGHDHGEDGDDHDEGDPSGVETASAAEKQVLGAAHLAVGIALLFNLVV